jgi:hypothetical protein
MPKRADYRRRYSDEERETPLAALAANAGRVRRTSSQLGIPEPTIRAWSKGRRRHPEALQEYAQKKSSLSDACEAVAWRLTGYLRGGVAGATFKQAAIALAILCGKLLLLRGYRGFVRLGILGCPPVRPRRRAISRLKPRSRRRGANKRSFSYAAGSIAPALTA